MATWKKIVLEEDITGAGPISVSSSAFSLSISGLTDAGTPGATDKILSWNGSVWETVDASEFLGAAAAAITSFTNGLDNRVVTATGTAGANAEAKLTFSSSTLEVVSSNTSSGGIKMFGGVYGSAPPYITPSGNHTTLKFGDGSTNHIYDFQQNKIAFDSDATNTYIAANAETPEDLEIHADQDILLDADNKTIVNSNLDIIGDTNFTGGVIGGSAGYLSVLESKITNGAANASGEIGIGTDVYYGGSSSTTVAGYLFYLNYQSGWSSTSATSDTRAAHGLMGVARNDSASKGIVLKGVCYLASAVSGSVGDPLYLSTASGRLTNVAPSATGNVVRVMGYRLSSNLVFFAPDKYWRVI